MSQTPEEVLLQREEMRERNKQAAAAAKRRIRHTPDKTAQYLSKGRTFISSTMASEFGSTFRPLTAYFPPMFRATLQKHTGPSDAKSDMQVTTAFPSAGAALAKHVNGTTGTMSRTLGSSARLPETAKILATLRQYKSTSTLCQKSERGLRGPHTSQNASTALNSPVVATVPKPAAYRLTNGMIGDGKPKLNWSAGDDEDSVVLPALPLTIKEESDPVKKHIVQV